MMLRHAGNGVTERQGGDQEAASSLQAFIQGMSKEHLLCARQWGAAVNNEEGEMASFMGAEGLN